MQASIGYLPGGFVAYPDLTTAEFLRCFGNLRGRDGLVAGRRAAARIELDLTGRVGTLSHGNWQKVGVVQACTTVSCRPTTT